MSTAAAAPAAPPMYEWNALPWKSIQRRVFKLQKRIYQASRRGDTKAVHKLRRLQIQSWHARLLAVRRVTQDNRGKATAGVDGVKSLAPARRLRLASGLRVSPRAQPVRRVSIPKPGTTEQRPLGIPTMGDRAAQALVKLALEPEWEARFEPNSYGFRPGRSCHDAAQALWTSLNQKAKYVLDADIAKCFDRINHAALLDKLHTFPTLRRAVRAWLKAGVMDGGSLFPTDEGTPQGGVLSPLLANVALHGLEGAIRARYPRQLKGRQTWKPVVVRYADDFVVLHESLAVIEEVKRFVQAWLAGMGLELKPSKTRVTHSLREHEGGVGFDFLGFHVRQHPVGKTHSARRGNGRHESVRLGFKTRVTPSKESQRRHYAQLAALIERHQATPQAGLIERLNPVIRGWTRYHSAVVSGRVFARLRCLLFTKLRRWAKRRHPKKRGDWVSAKYWRLETGHWTFATRDGATLYQHSAARIRRHVKVRGDKSPFDGDWVYWSTRLGAHPEVATRVATLLQRQRGRCARCGLYFTTEGDLPEVDHIVPNHLGGSDAYSNLQLLHRHRHRHDAKTARDDSLAATLSPRPRTQ
jgi:RNA-directed DNA polymerase